MAKPTLTGWTACASALVIAACGARTGFDSAPGDAGDTRDAAFDAARGDASHDGPVESGADAPTDVALDSPIDASRRSDCADAGVTYIYVLTSDDYLYSFDPPTSTFTKIGLLSCPAPQGQSPNSMAVDRKGIAYVSSPMAASIA